MRRSILLFSILAGCGAAQAPAPAAPSVHLVDLAWLTLGPWQTEPDENACFSVETWQRVDDTHLTGHSIEVCSADDSVARVTEEIVFEERPDGIFYVASPVGQERTEFRLTEADATHFVVESPTHDFPTRVAYRLVDETHVEAVVSGGERSFTLAMTRASDTPDPD
jgi:hypothetical protein